MKRFIIATLIALSLAVPYAYSQTIGDPASGAGTSCKPDRITKAVVTLRTGQVLTLRSGIANSLAKETRVFYADRRAEFDLFANKHGASVDSPNSPVGFSAKCG